MAGCDYYLTNFLVVEKDDDVIAKIQLDTRHGYYGYYNPAIITYKEFVESKLKDEIYTIFNSKLDPNVWSCSIKKKEQYSHLYPDATNIYILTIKTVQYTRKYIANMKKNDIFE